MNSEQVCVQYKTGVETAAFCIAFYVFFLDMIWMLSLIGLDRQHCSILDSMTAILQSHCFYFIFSLLDECHLLLSGANDKKTVWPRIRKVRKTSSQAVKWQQDCFPSRWDLIVLKNIYHQHIVSMDIQTSNGYTASAYNKSKVVIHRQLAKIMFNCD